MTPVPTSDRLEQGFTLLEVVVTAAIFSVASVLGLNFLDSVNRSTSKATLLTRAQQETQYALRTMTQQLRSANPLTGAPCAAGLGRCLQFEVKRPTAWNDNCTRTTYAYTLTANAVTQTRTQYNASCAVVRTTTGTLLTGVTNAADNVPVFTYFNRSGLPLDPATQAAAIVRAPFEGGTASVRMNVRVRYMRGAPVLDLSSTVALRNNR